MKEEKKFSMETINHAVEGIKYGFLKERNMKIHGICMIIVVLFGHIFNISKVEWFVCLILFAGVVSTELMNTAIERTIDILIPYEDERAKVIKDLSAGSVLVWAIIAFILGIFIFLPKIF